MEKGWKSEKLRHDSTVRGYNSKLDIAASPCASEEDDGGTINIQYAKERLADMDVPRWCYIRWEWANATERVTDSLVQ